MDKLAKMVAVLIDRWTSKSPKAAQITTDVALGIGIVATVVTLIPITMPMWVLPTTAFAIALSAKLTKE